MMNPQSTAKLPNMAGAPARHRILVLADSFPNPSESFVADHLRLMGEAGWQVTLLARQCNDGAGEAAIALGSNIRLARIVASSARIYSRAALWLARRPWTWANPFMWRCALHGARVAASAEAGVHWDVVHAHFGNNAVSALVAAPQWRSRLVANFHGHDATSVPKLHGWTAYRRILGDAHAVAHSAFIEDRLRQCTDLRIHRVTMGVDLDRFLQSPRPSAWPSPLKLLSVGRLTQQKGHAQAIEAMCCLARRHPTVEIRLAIVGDGPERARLQSMIRHLGLTSRVELLGSVPYAEMPALYRQHHVLLLAAQATRDGQQEAFGRAAVEAMACGLPVVGCPIGGLPDTIGPGGVVADGFDAKSIANAITQVLEQASPDAWAERTRNRAMDFSIQYMAADYAAIADLIMREAGDADAE